MEFLNESLSIGWGFLSILIIFNGAIFVHELGHFLAARRRGLTVDCFSLFGIGPKLIKWKGKGDTEFCICALPFGAYVSIPQLAQANKSDTSSRTSYWDLIISVIWGPLANLLFALFLASILWIVGYPSDSSLHTTQIGYVHPTINNLDDVAIKGPAYEAGLLAGDKILTVDGSKVSNFRDISQFIITGSSRDTERNPLTTLEIERDGQKKTFTVQPTLITFNRKTNDQIRQIGIEPKALLKVGKVLKNSPAEKAGLKPQDIIRSANGEPIYHIATLLDLLKQHRKKPIDLEIERDQKPLFSVQVQAQLKVLTKPTVQIQPAFSDAPVLEIIPHYSGEAPIDPSKETSFAMLQVFKVNNWSPTKNLENPSVLHSLNGNTTKNLFDFKQNWQEARSQENSYTLELLNPKTQALHTLSFQPKSMLVNIDPQENFIIGITSTPIIQLVHMNPIEQMEEQISKTFHLLGKLIHPESDIGLRHLSGPVGIGRIIYQFSQTKDNSWKILIWFGVLLNVNLAILNLLPIPVLDGGHLFFGTIQALFRNKIPNKIFEGIQNIFVILLFLLMFYVLFYDSMRWIGDNEMKQQINREKARIINLK